jgi:hypothetical protein
VVVNRVTGCCCSDVGRRPVRVGYVLSDDDAATWPTTRPTPAQSRSGRWAPVDQHDDAIADDLRFLGRRMGPSDFLSDLISAGHVASSPSRYGRDWWKWKKPSGSTPLDPPQTVGWSVIGVRPVSQVGVWEVRDTPRIPGDVPASRARHPVAGGGALGQCGVGADLTRCWTRNRSPRAKAVVGGHAVVGAPPRQEVDLPRLAGGQTLDEVLDQRRDRLGGQWSAEELRLGVEVARLQWPL